MTANYVRKRISLQVTSREHLKRFQQSPEPDGDFDLSDGSSLTPTNQKSPDGDVTPRPLTFEQNADHRTSKHDLTRDSFSNNGRNQSQNCNETNREEMCMLASNGWTTGNTTERSSIYSLGEEFDKASSRNVAELFHAIDSMLYEGGDGPQALSGECRLWTSTFPHIRVLGHQIAPTTDCGYEIIARPEEDSHTLLTDVTELDLTGVSTDSLAVQGTRLYPLTPPTSCDSTRFAHLKEDVIVLDGLVEDVISVHYLTTDEDNTGYQMRPTLARGMPPVTPRACIKDNVMSAMYDLIWAQVVTWLRPIILQYSQQLNDRGIFNTIVCEDDLVTETANHDSILSREVSLLTYRGNSDKPQSSNKLSDLLTISTKTLLKRDKSNLHESVDLSLVSGCPVSAIHGKTVGATITGGGGGAGGGGTGAGAGTSATSRPLSVRPLLCSAGDDRFRQSRAKTGAGRRLLAPIVGPGGLVGFSGAPVLSNVHLVNGQSSTCVTTSNLLTATSATTAAAAAGTIAASSSSTAAAANSTTVALGGGGGGGAGVGQGGAGAGPAVSLLACAAIDGRSRTPNAVIISQEEEKRLRLQNEVLRGHRLMTSDPSPPPNFPSRNGTLPPLESGGDIVASSLAHSRQRLTNNRVSSAAYHDHATAGGGANGVGGVAKDSTLPRHAAIEQRPNTTHMLYRTDMLSGRRSSTPMGYQNTFKLGPMSVNPQNIPAPGDLNVTGSGINPHNNNDINDFTEFGDIIHVSNWSSSALPARRSRVQQPYQHMSVR